MMKPRTVGKIRFFILALTGGDRSKTRGSCKIRQIKSNLLEVPGHLNYYEEDATMDIQGPSMDVHFHSRPDMTIKAQQL